MKQDFRFGQLCSMQANINRNKKKRSQPYTTEDFAMRPWQQKATPEDKAQKIRSSFDMLAGVKKEKPKKIKKKAQ